MESVCNESNVWVQESHDVRHGLLNLGSWVEDKLDPSIYKTISLANHLHNKNFKTQKSYISINK